MAVTQRLRNSDGGEDREEVLKSLDNLLSQLTTGVFVDHIFNSISGFTFEGASKIFNLLEIPLYHGWIIDPMNPAQLAIGEFSYNNLMLHLLEMNDDGNKVVIEEFLKSQLTVTGLESLRAMIKEDEPCILYSNDHFHTLVNRPEAGLFTLVTDIGFQNRPNHVWQRLESVNGVNGPTEFYNANFEPTNPRSEVEKLDEKGSSQIRISVFYDVENIRATSNAYAAVRKLKDALCVYFPGAIPSLKAIGNIKRMQDVERLACDGHGFTIIDVPRKTRNAADIRIMVEMFRSALEYPAPGFMMLLSGDGDFCEAFECIGRLGFTTVLVYPEASVASELIESSDFAFSWNELCKGRGLVDKNGSRSSDVPLDHKVVVKSDHGRRLVFFWDIHAYPLPTQELNVHQFVTHRLANICYEREANYDKEKALFYAFGHPRTFPPAEVCKAIGNYIPTFK